jgi:hypothetical protein
VMVIPVILDTQEAGRDEEDANLGK